MTGKRKWLFVPLICLPYIVLASLLGIYFSPHPLNECLLFLTSLGMDNAQTWTGLLYGFYLILLGVVLLCIQCVQCSLWAFGLSLGQRWDAVWMAKTVMIVKLLLIPAYIVIFVLGVIMSVTVWLFMMALAFVILDAIIIALTGGLGAVAAYHAYKAGMLPKRKAVIFSVLQFVYCVDVVASIILFIQLKKAKTEVCPPLETTAA